MNCTICDKNIDDHTDKELVKCLNFQKSKIDQAVYYAEAIIGPNTRANAVKRAEDILGDKS